MEETGDQGSRGPLVLVVGAGYAGVAAAGALRAGGINDVIVLEAQGRAGGRVKTLKLAEGHLEFGAQFLHGQNEIYALAEKDNNLLDEEEEEESEVLPDTVLQYNEYDFYLPGGHLIDSHVVLENLRALEELQSKTNDALGEGLADDVAVSVGDYQRPRYAEALSATPGDATTKDAMLRWFEKWAIMDAGATVDQMSLAGTGQYVYIPGSGVKETKTGMEDVFRSFLRQSLPPENLVLNKPVKTIRWVEEISDSVHLPPELDRVSSEGESAKICMNNNYLRAGERMPTGLTIMTSSEAKAVVAGLATRVEQLGRRNEENGMQDSKKTQAGDFDQNTGAILEEERTYVDLKRGVKTDGDVGQFTSKGVLLEIPGRGRTSAGDNMASFERSQEKARRRFRVNVECEDGEVFHADHVIVTSSIGFLKSNDDFFQPPLPSSHRKAVNSMGFGNVAKIFLIWDVEEGGAALGSCFPCMYDVMAEWQRQVLGDDVWGAVFLWPDGDRPQLKSAVSSRTTSTGRQWFEDISLWELTSGLDTCISVWVGGEAATIMESLPESEVKDVLHEMLVLFLDKPGVPRPTRIIRSGWHSNPYTRGAYSFLATGAPLELHDVLSQPIPSQEDPVLQLAGEACSKHYYSTAHGALQSGKQAASAILRHHNRGHE